METLSVSQVNTLARTVLEDISIWVEGEVSNASADKYYYKYFSLKDQTACIACVIAMNKLTALDFKIEDGIQIKAFGTLSIFERDGKFQLKVEKVEKAGEAGDLQKQFEELKNKLQKEGLFDDARKRPIPKFPKRIAVITSKDGAAWKDFFKILSTRYPNLEVLLYDVLVQGDKSASSVTQALTYINGLEEIDVVVITRGGGSLEDLWSFNDELLARAVYTSKYPVVSAIGHEKDFTILDLVADLRASTPSNAAELISPEIDTLFQILDTMLAKMQRWAENKLSMTKLQLISTVERSSLVDKAKFIDGQDKELNASYEKLKVKLATYKNLDLQLEDIFCKIELKAKQATLIRRNELQNASQKLEIQIKTKTNILDRNLTQMKEKIATAANTYICDIKNTLETLALKIELNNPLKILEKGYSIVSDSQGKILTSVKTIKEGGTIQTRLSDGSFISTISSIQKKWKMNN